MDENKRNKVLGCLFGQAVGDALGMGLSSLTKKVWRKDTLMAYAIMMI